MKSSAGSSLLFLTAIKIPSQSTIHPPSIGSLLKSSSVSGLSLLAVKIAALNLTSSGSKPLLSSMRSESFTTISVPFGRMTVKRASAEQLPPFLQASALNCALKPTLPPSPISPSHFSPFAFSSNRIFSGPAFVKAALIAPLAFSPVTSSKKPYLPGIRKAPLGIS